MRYDQMCKHRDQLTMTSDHGRLLRDSGFLKRGLHRSSLDSSVLTTTLDQIESCYQSERKDLIELYSGRRAIAATHWTGAPSTSVSPLIAAGYIASIRSNIKPELTKAMILHQLRQAIERLFEHTEAARWYSPKTSCPPLRWELPALPQATPSWVQSLHHTAQTIYYGGARQSRRGSIPTQQVMMLGDMFDPDCGTLVSSASISKLLKTRSATASGKYGST